MATPGYDFKVLIYTILFNATLPVAISLKGCWPNRFTSIMYDNIKCVCRKRLRDHRNRIDYGITALR